MLNRSLAVMGAALMLSVSLAGCGGGSAEKVATRTVTPDASTVTVTSTPPQASPTSPTPSESATASSPSDSSSSDAIVPPEAKGRVLHLNEFFNPDKMTWEEGRFDVASKSQVMGLAADISSCGDTSAKELELRLAHRFQRLSFSAGQNTQSKSAQDKVIVEVVTNGSTVESHSIPFDSIQKFDVPVAGVNSVVIRSYLDDGVDDCGSHGNSTIVITDATVK